MTKTHMFRLEMLHPINDINPIGGYVSTNEDKRHSMWDSESDFDVMNSDLLSLKGTDGDADMDE